MGIGSQVSHIADADRVTYRGEPTDYSPGIADATLSRLVPSVREQIYSASFGQSGPEIRGEADTSPSDAGQSCGKRQRLDDG